MKMKHSNQFDYLATIKKNHKIHTQIDKKDEEDYITTLYRHYKSMAHIRRLAGIPLIQSYSVAQHSYMTGLLFEDIAMHEHIKVTEYEKRAVYRHDIFETVTGDMLLPVKIHSASVKRHWEAIEKELIQSKYKHLIMFSDEVMENSFTPEAYNLFKACDLFELYLFCWEETQLGNMSDGIWAVIYNCQRLLPEFGIPYITNIVQSPLEIKSES